MAHHEKEKVEAAVSPAAYDMAVASDVILAELFRGYVPIGELFAAVEKRLASEPIPALAHEIEGVKESDVRRVRSAAVTMTALAHLEARGAILPVGPHTYHHAGGWSIPAVTDRYKGGYNVDGPYNYAAAAGYRPLSFASRAPVIESPELFLAALPEGMGQKVRRVLVEAVGSYRSGQFFATAVLLGVASEAAWRQVANTVLSVTGDSKLRAALEDQYPRAGAILDRVLELVVSMGLKGMELASLTTAELGYRDLRNYAVHRPEESFSEARVARPVVGSLLEQAVDYFRRLYDLNGRILESKRVASDSTT